MHEESRAYVAWTAGRLMAHWKGSVVQEKEEGRSFDLLRREKRQPLEHFSRRKACEARRDPEGTNFCLICPADGQHICLTTFDRQFTGFDHGSASHFSGYVGNGEVCLYDYGESKFFVFEA